MNYVIGESEAGRTVAVVTTQGLKVADQNHAAFDRIVRAVTSGASEYVVCRLFDATDAINERLSEYTSLVKIKGNTVYYDSEPVGGDLGRKIVQVYRAGETVKPLVKFLENLMKNPSHRSRNQLFRYLDLHDWQITADGNFIAYKGLSNDGRSVHSGTAFVNGKKVVGRIPNSVGDVITMPRSQVSDDPNVACHVGLHAGAWSYASTFGRGTTMIVEINPADVVSVPSDSNVQKLRTCKYKVIEVTKAPEPESQPYFRSKDWDEAYNEGYEEGYEAALEEYDW